MLWKLLIGLAQVKPVNTSEKLLNEIGQIIYFLCQAKKKKFNNIMHSIKLEFLTQIFHIMKSCLLIKTLNHLRLL